MRNEDSPNLQMCQELHSRATMARTRGTILVQSLDSVVFSVLIAVALGLLNCASQVVESGSLVSGQKKKKNTGKKENV